MFLFQNASKNLTCEALSKCYTAKNYWRIETKISKNQTLKLFELVKFEQNLPYGAKRYKICVDVKFFKFERVRAKLLYYVHI